MSLLRGVASTARALLVGLAPFLVAAQEPPLDADKQFDEMLAAAKEAPEKADWMKLRRGFAETSRYQPYNRKWEEELDEIRTRLKGDDPITAEAALDKLMEREGWMRLDAHYMAAAHYARTGRKEKEDFHARFAKGIASTIFVPGTGMSFEEPIRVLFIEEEYNFFRALKMKAAREGLSIHEGSKFDVFKAEVGEGGEIKFYFNVDLPQKALNRMFKELKQEQPDEV